MLAVINSATCGLSRDSYDKGVRLLCGHRNVRDSEKSKRTVHQRFQPYYLPELKTARTVTISGLGEVRSLPGIGTDFWSHARAHLFRGTVPPVLPDVLFQNEVDPRQKHIPQFCKDLRNLWPAGPCPFGTLHWEQARMFHLPDGRPSSSHQLFL